MSVSTSPMAIAILGPTASGKTALSEAIASLFDVEIISIDSALVYRDMTIGTAKPDDAFRQKTPHHLIDIISPLDSYSAAQFRTDAIQLIHDILSRKRLPLLVGGTMLYFRALSEGLNALPSANPEIRKQLDDEASQIGWPALHQRLQQIDPIVANRLAPADSQRIQRALEVYYLTGQPMSYWLNQPATDSPLPCPLKTIALIPSDRPRLHNVIHRRFDQMIEDGLIDEVRSLRTKYPDLHIGLPSMRCVGYRQVWEYLDHPQTIENLREKGYAATRQLCKRQLTWLRRMKLDHVIDPFSPDAVETGIHIVKQICL